MCWHDAKVTESLQSRTVDLFEDRTLDSGTLDLVVQNHVGDDGSSVSDGASHGRETVRVSVLHQTDAVAFRVSAWELGTNVVVQHNQIRLVILEGKDLGKVLGKSVDWSSVTIDDLVREESKILKSRESLRADLLLNNVSERVWEDVEFLVGERSHQLFPSEIWSDGRRERIGGVSREQSDRVKGLDGLNESLIAESSTEDRVAVIAESVDFRVLRRVTVRESNQVESRHEVNVDQVIDNRSRRHLDNLSVLQILGRVHQSSQHAFWGPRELVAKRVVRPFWSRKSSTERLERSDASTMFLDVIEAFHGEHVVDSRVETGLVHDSDISVLSPVRFDKRIKLITITLTLYQEPPVPVRHSWK